MISKELHINRSEDRTLIGMCIQFEITAGGPRFSNENSVFRPNAKLIGNLVRAIFLKELTIIAARP